MGAAVMTTIDTVIEPERERELIEGFRRMTEGCQPEGLIRSELLRGQGGALRIQTTWRGPEALLALRASGEPPAALALLDRLGAQHSHTVHTVERSIEASPAERIARMPDPDATLSVITSDTTHHFRVLRETGQMHQHAPISHGQKAVW